MRIVLIVLLGILALPVSAQLVYKCRDHNGNPLYQSFPCGGTKPPEKTWAGDYRPRANAELWADYNRNQAWTQRQQREHRSSAQPYRVVRGNDIREQSRRAACAASRSEYARVQADFKLNRIISLLRRLESQIRQYCEVRP